MGSERKKYLMDYDFLTTLTLSSDHNNDKDCEVFRRYIKSDFFYRKNVVIKRVENKVSFTLFGYEVYANITPITKPITTPACAPAQSASKGAQGDDLNDDLHPNTYKPAEIKISNDSATILIPSHQIDLNHYIVSVKNSEGISVANDQVGIYFEGTKLSTSIIESISTPCIREYEYQYIDSHTGLLIKKIILNFVLTNSSILGNTKELLISIPSHDKYTISYNVNIAKIIFQINTLELSKYAEIIACSLRSLFEISIDSLIKSSKYQTLFDGITKLEERVAHIIQYASESTRLSKISFSSKIEFTSLKNMLNIQDFSDCVSIVHLGAHKSTTYISEADISKVAKKVGIYIVIVNELLTNPAI